MFRNLNALAQKQFDVLVIGGGIYGAAVTWEAASRGLSVALVEKDDFCGATSANSLKTIHGGLRYLQHADFQRMRESISERTTLMRIAPHLIHPLPVLVPTYGHRLKGREVMALATFANDLISFDRNLPDPEKRLPHGYTISRRECLQRLPGIPENNLTGGAVFYDAQAYNTERLVIDFLHSAVQSGAEVANYVQAVGFRRQANKVIGIEARDHLTGSTFDIQARMIINTAGPWVNSVLGLLGPAQPPAQLALSMNIITRPLFERFAVGLSAPKSYQDADALLNKGNRLLFFSPWRDRSLIGTTADPYHGAPDNFEITETEVQRFLNEINQAYPAANLTLDDVTFVHAGLLPSPGIDHKSGDARIAKHYQLIDHRQAGIDGLLTVVGVKYTTARHVAEKVIDHVSTRQEKPLPKSTSAMTRLHGGQIDRFDDFLQTAVQQQPCGLDASTLRHLVYTYGSNYPTVLQSFDMQTTANLGMTRSLLQAETRHAVRQEMAQTLGDVLFRRTDWGSAGHPGAEVVAFTAEVMAAELGWTPDHTRQEIEAVNTRFAFGRGTYAAALAGSTL
ncbi:MAG TPA: glycerol-3-phosphate dehydrogenase/oxidase [Phototrophicaceae bacterium]|nr:glycerol-3-phosphate dehydrogenase/oxidase [Phototrophicaceae bacterium]